MCHEFSNCFNRNFTIIYREFRILNQVIYIDININNHPSNNLPTLKKLRDQEDVIRIDHTIMTLIWKYLNLEDKFNCTLVCKKFNKMITEMDCFRLNLYYPSDVQIIPVIKRNYKTVTFHGYKCKSLESQIRELLQHLKPTLVDLKFINCEFNMMAFSEFLRQLPLLQSLDLKMNLTMDLTINITEKKNPKLL